MRRPSLFIILAAGLLSPSNSAADESAAPDRLFTFSWMFRADDDMTPRGGTTRGPNLTLDKSTSQGFRALKEDGLTKKERDRRAILAMAGRYRASFEFLETVGFDTDYEPPRPYQSWTTERVYVVADEEDLISLQHIMVIRTVSDDGTESSPMVMKHWRQDWRFEDRDLLTYLGHRTWQSERRSRAEVRGTWSQAVFQVDDSPRYESLGRWQHEDHASIWQGSTTRRPLPRRESSVRGDYHTLEGNNRHTIIATGWIHEQDNHKVVLGAPQSDGAFRRTHVLARETGLNRYVAILDYDFSAGDAYWRQTRRYWAGVRNTWEGLAARHERITLRAAVSGSPLFVAMFEGASAFEKNPALEVDDDAIRETIAAYLVE